MLFRVISSALLIVGLTASARVDDSALCMDTISLFSITATKLPINRLAYVVQAQENTYEGINIRAHRFHLYFIAKMMGWRLIKPVDKYAWIKGKVTIR